MYKKIMVPLDGSELAECVLPHVEAFNKGFSTSDIILVRVIEPETTYRGEYVISPEMIAKRESERKSLAKTYLENVANQLQHEGASLRGEVIVGKVMESLANCAVENEIDLILIATHGRSGVTRWVMGSVADKILRSADVPVLMVRAPGSKSGI